MRRSRTLLLVLLAAFAAPVLLLARPTHANAASAHIAAPAIHQAHGLNCETTALQIALWARGIAVSQDALDAAVGNDPRKPVTNSGNVVQWGDPYTTFVGDLYGSEPALTGYGVYYPPIVAAARQAGSHAVGATGWNPRDLYAAVAHGDPVVVWVVNGLGSAGTRTWTAWDGRSVPYVIGEHAETLIGFDDSQGSVTLSNPWTGRIDTVPMGRFESSFAVFGNMAVVVGGADVAMLPSPDGRGYTVVGYDGGVQAFGDAVDKGSLGGQHLNAPVIGAAATRDGGGYWMAASDGGVFAFGNASFRGSMGGRPLNAPMVGMAATPGGSGYWLVAADGGIFTFGKAPFLGSTGGRKLNAPVVAMAATPSGRGYWLVAADGGVFCFGDAQFHGSTGGRTLNAPIVGMSVASGGYRLVASDGGVFTFGAAFFGSTGGQHLNAPVVTMATTPNGGGYWMLASDGGVFTFGDAGFYGSEA